MNKRNVLIWMVILCALALRIAMVVWAGNAQQTSATGGSDTFAYQALADSIAAHRGFSFAGMPTALRPPLYPLTLVLGQFIAGGHYRIFIRLVQFFIGIFTAIICARTSQKLGGSPAVALAAALAAPTLIFFSVELLSETFATLIVAAFFYVIIADSGPIWAGALIGLGMLERFNLTALAVAYVVYQFTAKKPSEAARHSAVAALVALIIVSPWFARNLAVFHGQVLYSTHTGTNLLQGVIMPDGRSQGDDFARLEAIQGWSITDIETNSPRRATFPAEPQLDRTAKAAAVAEFSHVNLFSLAARKLGYFWLGVDQMFRTQSLSRSKRLVRELGVLAYWLLLLAAILGWLELKSQNSNAARLFLSYAVIVTVMHLPFVMNTRIRTPLIEPMLAIFAGLAFTTITAPRRINSWFENETDPLEITESMG
jgi:Dolichyl-phosphate-mannose-protein mannosyltransferase